MKIKELILKSELIVSESGSSQTSQMINNVNNFLDNEIKVIEIDLSKLMDSLSCDLDSLVACMCGPVTQSKNMLGVYFDRPINIIRLKLDKSLVMRMCENFADKHELPIEQLISLRSVMLNMIDNRFASDNIKRDVLREVILRTSKTIDVSTNMIWNDFLKHLFEHSLELFYASCLNSLGLISILTNEELILKSSPKNKFFVSCLRTFIMELEVTIETIKES
jgi:hypothetical protein